LQPRPSTIDAKQRAEAAELVELAAKARRAFPRGAVDIAQTQVLLALARESDGRGVSETAADLALDASTVSHAARELRDEGLIAEASDPSDGRRRVYSLTAAGERAVAKYLRARRLAASSDRLDSQVTLRP
jgi:DNA-binding MarR family transcriptional regulator